MKKLLMLLGVGGMSFIFSATQSSVSQYGITWTFDKAYEVGQFVNGDWWVKGPVTITKVDPAPGAAAVADETARTNYVKNYVNQFGDTALQDNTAMRNGSQINPRWGSKQGYDSGCKNYDASLSVSFPRALQANQSLVSSISHKTLPNAKLLSFYNDQTYAVLKTAAVLTCLAAAPPADAFRPPYATSNKPIYRAGSIKWERLPQLTAPPLTPTVAQANRYVERPWIDHFSGSWLVQGSAPTENNDSYGRENARMISIASLRTMVTTPRAELEPLVYNIIQIGIDLHALRKDGANWYLGGGHGSSRKWPIVYAGVLLDDQEMQTFKGDSEFHEDQQTYYGTGWTGATALWQIVHHHGASPLYEQKAPNTWTDTDKRSHGYRMCCTGMSWIGQQVGALLIGAKKIWNHDAFFDYCDRFMTEQKTVYDGYSVSGLEYMGKAFDNFVNFMYRWYRNTAPVQDGATNNMKWMPLDGKWVADLNAPVTGVKKANPAAVKGITIQHTPNPVKAGDLKVQYPGLLIYTLSGHQITAEDAGYGIHLVRPACADGRVVPVMIIK